ncbi:MAG: DUF2975 domain-containing protein [Roseibium sp.]|nr:DUF2975 domain-containing protein [Roseibium sp.]
MQEQVQLERAQRLRRIHALSQVMKWFATVVIILFAVIAGIVAAAMFVPLAMEFVFTEALDIGDVSREIADIPVVQRIALALLIFLAFIILIIATWQIREVFSHFQRREFFAAQTLSRVISLGRWLVILGLYDFLSDPIGSLLLTIDLPAGQKEVEVSIDGGEIYFIIFGCMMILFGWIMREAASIEEENRQFI